MMETKHQAGFTLIELSIVLVIIGLIVGGVLVGRDMIHSAEIRATIAQLESFNTAANTFKTKYGHLPGDIPPAIAQQLGFFSFTSASAGSKYYGDDDGLLNMNGHCVEPMIFWRHLSEAQLIAGSYGKDLDPVAGFAFVTGDTTADIPPVKLGHNTQVFVGADGFASFNTWEGRVNEFLLADFTQISAGCFGMALTISPYEAFVIDTKLDDGLPYSGRVQDYQSGYGGSLSCTSAISNPTATWNVSTNADSPACFPVIKASF